MVKLKQFATKIIVIALVTIMIMQLFTTIFQSVELTTITSCG